MANLTGRFRIVVDVPQPPAGGRLWGDGTYGDGVYGGGPDATDPAPTTNVTCDVTGATVERGRKAGLDRCDVGRCTVTVTGWHPPFAAPSPNLLGRAFTLEGDQGGGVWRAVFTGTVEDATLALTGDGTGDPVPTWTIVAADPLAVLQHRRYEDGAPLLRPQESAALRVKNIAAPLFVSILSSYSDADTQVMAGTFTGTGWDHAVLACQSTGQILYALRDGTLAVDEESPDPVGVEDVTVAVTDGVTPPPAGAVDLGCPETASVRFPIGSVRNLVTVGNVADLAWQLVDQESVDAYGQRDYARTDLIFPSPGSADPLPWVAMAEDWLARYSHPRGWLTDVRIRLDGDQAVNVATTLEVVAGFDVTLPPDDQGTRWHATGRTLGHRWDITPHAAHLTLFTESPVTER